MLAKKYLKELLFIENKAHIEKIYKDMAIKLQKNHIIMLNKIYILRYIYYDI